MSDKRLRVVLLTHGGTEKALEYLLALDCATVAGVFIETQTTRRYTLKEKIRRSVRYDGYATTLAKLARAAFNRSRPPGDEGAMLDSRERLRVIAEQHGVPIHFLTSYHTDDSIALMRAAEADLGVVLGTNILKESVFKIPRLGCINLHQGLAPYYRGCPPVFWELYNGEREVGLTVHFVETKVDTGEIVLQTTVPLNYDYSYGL
ncbi:MAG TPA: formyltransferase family protein, partial [Blastocatellia bacterium]|nr:formyltransferase family protein [Blastocatellia bacterium]